MKTLARYFIVNTKCGHVGKLKCVWIDFAVVADSPGEAVEKVRGYKRVKRHHKDVVRLVREVDFEEFMMQKAINDSDPYLHCKNIQQQRLIENLGTRICDDEWNIRRQGYKEKKTQRSVYRMKKTRIAVKEACKRIAEYIEEVA